MKIFFAQICLFLLLAIDIYPDSVILNSNELKEGTILSEDESTIILQTPEGKQSINKADIKSIEIGISGVSSCVSFVKKPKAQECSYRLVSLTEKNAYFITPKNLKEPEGFPIKKILSITILKDEDNTKLLSYVKKNMPVQLELTNGMKDNGLITETSNGALVLKRPDETTETYFEVAIASIKYTNPNPEKGFPLRTVVPGWYQYNIGQKQKGQMFMGLFAGITGIMIYEYHQANSLRTSEENKYNYLKLDNNRIIMYYNPDYANYQRHRNAYYAMGGALGLLYLVNFYDVFRSGQKSINVSVGEEIYNGRKEHAMQLKFNFNF